MSGGLLAALHYTVLNSPHQRKGSYKIRDMNIGTVKYSITNILTEGRDVTRSGREISPCAQSRKPEGICLERGVGDGE